MSINRVALSGNLTRDPELRGTQGGSQVLAFGIAVNDRRRNAQGEWEDVPNYVDCVVFGNRADALKRLLTKGQKVVLEGRLRWSQWEREGQKHSKLEVIVDNLDFVSRPQASQAQASAPAPYGAYAQAPAAPAQAAPYAQNYGAPAPTPAASTVVYGQGNATTPAQAPAQAPAAAAASADSIYDEEIPF